MQDDASRQVLQMALKQRCRFAYLVDANVREDGGKVYLSQDSIACGILLDSACRYTSGMQDCLLRQVYKENILGDGQ